MDGHNFIALAGKLAVAPAADEATYRTAVSRAYYGAFHVARVFLIDLGFVPVRNANVHAFVRRYLSGSGEPELCLSASILRELQAARNRADYNLDDPNVGSQAVAMATVEDAHRIASAVDRCRTDVSRESIRQAIGDYERQIRPPQ
jgi:uncharacterized protein (UPF0332 family)